MNKMLHVNPGPDGKHEGWIIMARHGTAVIYAESSLAPGLYNWSPNRNHADVFGSRDMARSQAKDMFLDDGWTVVVAKVTLTIEVEVGQVVETRSKK